MDNPVLEARGLRKSFGSGDLAVEVLKGIDMAVRPGEFVAVLGPSGSGKSTLLHVLGLMESPTQGEIRLAGDDARSLSDRARARLRNRVIGFVFQFDSLLPEFSVLENICLPGWIRAANHPDPVSEPRPPAPAPRGEDALPAPRCRAHISRPAPTLERAMELLRTFSIASLADRSPQRLSGGERQRVAIARALLNRPALLLADEPTGNLDRHNGELVFNIFKDISDRLGVAVVMVTHNESAAQAADRVLYLSDGTLVQK